MQVLAPFVSVLMGSHSDLPILEETLKVLRELNVPFEAHVLSAHRTPHATVEYVEEAERRGCAVFIAAAGLAAHLAGTVAAHSLRPVIGIPLEVGGLGGLDALLSTVQMPGGIPVACTAVGKAGAQNAAFLAAQILALQDSAMLEQLKKVRHQKSAALKAADDELQKQLILKRHP